MDTQLFDLIGKDVPEFNPVVCDGLPCTHIGMVEQYIDKIFKCAAVKGLTYDGYARCTPTETYNVVTAKRGNNKQSFDLARSDVYLLKYFFRYEGVQLPPCYIFLPFVGDGGIIRIQGSTFAISPVLADPAISVGSDNIFIPLTRDKLTFKRLAHPLYIDGERRENFVVTAQIYHRKAVRRGQDNGYRSIVNMLNTPVLYLFCKYGVRETFRRFANINVEIGKEDTINTTNYPPELWRICTSIGMRPKGVRGKAYYPTHLRLAIPRSAPKSTLLEGIVGAFFYLCDHFPTMINLEEIDDPTLWMVLMGYIELEPGIGEGKMLIGITAHIESLDEYMDVMAQRKLADVGVNVDDIYELFVYVIEIMPEALAQSSMTIASMYDKKLIVLPYVLSEIVNSINKWMFDLKKRGKQGNRILTEKDVIESMRQHIKMEMIFRINRDHPEVANISSPTDNKLFKITSAVGQQNTSGKLKGGSHNRNAAYDPSKVLHSSLAEIGSLNNLPKSEPTGRSRLNPYVHASGTGIIERNPELKPILDKLQTSIQR